MEILPENMAKAWSKMCGVSVERVHAAWEAERLRDLFPKLSVATLRRACQDSEFSKHSTALRELFSSMSDAEIRAYWEDGNPNRLFFVREPEDAGLRLRQLQSLLGGEAEFRTRYPAAHRALFGDASGVSRVSSLYLPSFDVRIPRRKAKPFVAWSKSGRHPWDSYSHLIDWWRPEDPAVDQGFWRLDSDYIGSLLIELFYRDEVKERFWGNTLGLISDDNLLESLGAPKKPSDVRITDLRLAFDHRPKDLLTRLVPVLGTLGNPVTTENVARWKRKTLENPAKLTEYGFPDAGRGTMAVSFAAAALLLFIDLDMPGIEGMKASRLAQQISYLAETIRELAGGINDAVARMEQILANRAPGRQARRKREHYMALCLYRMGYELSDIAIRQGINPYESSKVQGTRDWKAKITNKIRAGKSIESSRYPRAAAIFTHADNLNVREKAQAAYEAYADEYGDAGAARLCYAEDHGIGFHRQGWFRVCKSVRVDPYARTGLEVAHAYVQLGFCLADDRELLP